MYEHRIGRLLGAVTVLLLSVSACTSSPPEGGGVSEPSSPAAQTSEAAASSEDKSPPEATASPSTAASAESKSQKQLPDRRSSSESSEPEDPPGQFEGEQTDETRIPDLYSVESCADSTSTSCLEPLDVAPSGAAPPTSGVTGDVYPYTVTEYLEWIIDDLDREWADWFARSGFNPPRLYYEIVYATDAPYTSNCVDLRSRQKIVVSHDHPNAFYCEIDPYVLNPKASGTGLVILPITTMQKMWTGEVLGTRSKLAGDFAAAVIVAHEFGHHVQDEMALQWENYYGQPVRAFTGSNKEAIADCFAGVWMTTAYYNGLLQPNDVEEAIEALTAVGAPQPGTSHPTPDQRREALLWGYRTPGDPMTCVDRYWQ